MVHVRSDEEVALIRESAQLVSKTLGEISKMIKPGITTRQLDKIAEEFIKDHGGKPGFMTKGFPNTLCMSVNEMVVHGIPNDRPLKDGDILSVDCGVVMNGYFGDHAFTFPVGEVAPEVIKLLKITKECLDIGISHAVVGNRVGDISFHIQRHAEKNGYSVVRELVGHGVGTSLHEEPEVPNFGKKGKGPLLKNGFVLAIEPMINMGGKRVAQLEDGWTIITKDRRPSAHFEHDVVVRRGKPEVLSTFDYIDPSMKKFLE